MFIKSIIVANFRSFENLEMYLGKINCLIGANSSGKSNFLYIFEFLRDIVDWGLENAISMQGGPDFLLNFNIGVSKPLSFQITVDLDWVIPRKYNEENYHLHFVDLDYRFSIQFNNKDNQFVIKEDQLILRIKVSALNEKNVSKANNAQDIEYLADIKLTLIKIDDEVKTIFEDMKSTDSKSEHKEPSRDIQNILVLSKNLLSLNSLIIESQNSAVLIGFPFFQNIVSYDFDPKRIKQATPFTGFNELENDGSNLAIILKNIISNEETNRKFNNLMNEVLPYVKSLEVKKFLDASLFLVSNEIYTKKSSVPAPQISDGTINIITLIVALYFQENDIIFLEEPEKSIHPYLISRIVDLFIDASKDKQITFTTHNPLFVKYIGLKNLLFLQRNNNGFTEILKLEHIDEVKTFLENEMGIEDLFIDNLIGGYK